MKLSRQRARLVGCATTAAIAMLGTTLSYTGTAAAARVADASVTPATSITMWTGDGPDQSWQQALIPEFTKLTGIKVTYDSIPEDVLQNKVTAAQEVKSTSFAMYEEPESLTPSYNALNAISPLTSYLSNSTLTPASFDLAGIPKASEAQCTLSGVVYCLPQTVDPGPELFYNIGMFKAAGLNPPTNWNQVLADANKLTTKKVSGICIRGSVDSPNGYPVLLMLPYFLPYAPNYQGEYLNANWVPLFNTPQALTWAKLYAHIMQNDTPPGVSAYGYPQCVQAFQAGQTAMFWDDSTLANTLYSKSIDPKEAANAGIDELHCPAWNQTCLLEAPWGFFINKNVNASQQLAAWELIEWLASPSTQIQALNSSKDAAVATRPATLTYAIAHASNYGVPTQFLQAVAYAGAHVEPNAIPNTAAFPIIQNTLFVTDSELIAAQITPQQAVELLQSNMVATLKTYGLPPK
jgi:ABC-type glycerol-3-phosphate transport system substrate-binding protein